MTTPQDHAFTRRAFLSRGLTLASAAATVPHFLQRSAFALPHAAPGLASIPGVPEGHVLVVVQLGGGNDGLNTVIPYADPAYYRARPGIGIREQAVLKLNKAPVGLHPQLVPLMELYDEGVLAVVQGVGYPNPDRSHFKSMDIWHTGDTSGTGTGWLGRYLDAECCGTAKRPARPEPLPMGAIALGREAPLALQGSINTPVAFETPDLFRWTGADVHASLHAPYDALTRQGIAAGTDPESNAAFLMRTALDARVASDRIRDAVARRPGATYPGNELARQLQMVAAMIGAGLPTRVYYVTLGGFDTHAGQGGENGRHANLLGAFAQSLRAFYADLRSQGNHERVLTMSFSEFGRRVRQNASQGTDHGTAAPMFLLGPMITPGVLTPHPSLTDLDDGDLRYNTDFRAVYAGILSGWLKADPRQVLEGSFKPVRVTRTA